MSILLNFNGAVALNCVVICTYVTVVDDNISMNANFESVPPKVSLIVFTTLCRLCYEPSEMLLIVIHFDSCIAFLFHYR